MFGDDNDAEEQEDTRSEVQILREERINRIYDMIQDNVGHMDEWLDEDSTIRILHGNLLIETTRANHESILTMLAGLRRSQALHYQSQLSLIEVFVLLKRAEDHRLNQDYDAALSTIDQALRVDPESPEAIAMREVVVATRRRGE